VLRLVFSCLRNAPASDTWDLSSLLVQGSPVSQATVTAVLEALYSNLGAFKPERSCKNQHSLAQLLDMLLFADAVNCSEQALSQLAALIETSRLEVLLIDSNTGAGSDSAAAANTAAADTAAGSAPAGSRLIKLQLHGVYSLETHGDCTRLMRLKGADSTQEYILTAPEVQQLQQQVSQQIEELLFVAFKLDLQQLLQPALRFLRANSPHLLKAVADADIASIFSQRVSAAAGGGSSVALLSRSFVQQPLGVGFGEGDLFGSITFDKAELIDAEYCKIGFTATLLRDLYEYSKGTRLHVTFHFDGELTLRDETTDNLETRVTFGTVAGPSSIFGANA
jgi:hypothetical protein